MTKFKTWLLTGLLALVGLLPLDKRDSLLTWTKHRLIALGDVSGLMAVNRLQFGGHSMMARGYNALADVVTRTADGRELNDIWDEFQATIAIQNASRQRIIDLLTFPVSQVIEDVPQFGTEEFEEASQYGVPKGVRPTTNILSLGYTFKWYDIANRFTWQFLAEASAQRVEAVHQQVLDADNRKIFQEVMRTLFRPTNRTANIRGQNFNVFTFWNGDGTVPPAYKTNTFPGTHTHFRTSGAAVVTSGDLDEIEDDFKSHGYSAANGSTMILLANVVEANVIRNFRVATGARYDFIPAAGTNALIVSDEVVLAGGQPAANFRGLNVIGKYGSLLIIEEEYVPPAYLVALVSGGPENLQNPIGLREHANASLRGLRLVKGREPDYPLIDSYYVRGFGTGVRQRGAGLVMQITTNGAYAAPAQYV
jgi:hypothetical protein